MSVGFALAALGLVWLGLVSSAQAQESTDRTVWSIDLEVGAPESVLPGYPFEYTYQVTNLGTIPLYDVVLTIPDWPETFFLPDLAPGESVRGAFNHTLGWGGQNSATFTATAESVMGSVSDSETVTTWGFNIYVDPYLIGEEDVDRDLITSGGMVTAVVSIKNASLRSVPIQVEIPYDFPILSWRRNGQSSGITGSWHNWGGKMIFEGEVVCHLTGYSCNRWGWDSVWVEFQTIGPGVAVFGTTVAEDGYVWPTPPVTLTVEPAPRPEVRIHVEASEEVQVGETLTYTASVFNAGNVPLTEVSLKFGVVEIGWREEVWPVDGFQTVFTYTPNVPTVLVAPFSVATAEGVTATTTATTVVRANNPSSIILTNFRAGGQGPEEVPLWVWILLLAVVLLAIILVLVVACYA